MRRFGLLAALAARRAARDESPQVLPPGVRIENDLAYGDADAQRLDVYRQNHAGTGAAPVIVFVHGGGWRRGDKAMRRMVGNKVAHWVGRGWVFVSINYRMLPEAGPLEQAEDVARALAFVQQHAADWGGDAGRIALVGHSAGAHLAALISADGSIATLGGARPWQATVALDTAALDMVAIMNRPHYRFYDPVFGSDPAFWQTASPTHRLNARPVAPMLLVCSSERDDSAPPAHAFAARAASFGAEVQVLPVALTHLQINDELGLPGAYTDAVDAFLRTSGVG